MHGAAEHQSQYGPSNGDGNEDRAHNEAIHHRKHHVEEARLYRRLWRQRRRAGGLTDTARLCMTARARRVAKHDLKLVAR